MALLNDDTRAKIAQALATYPERRSAFLPALKAAQEQLGWLNRAALVELAEVLETDPNALYMLATFYNMLHLEPVGRYVLALCNNVPCWLAGSDELLAHLQQRLGIHLNETTPDGRFTLKLAECLGACAKAPAMMLNERYCENLTRERIDALLDELHREMENGHARV
jgi:NADH-quinone oxidoreductase subunit E